MIQSDVTELDVSSTHVKVVSVSAQESKQAHYSIQKKKVSITTVMHKFQWFSKWDEEYKDIMPDEDYLVAEQAERACQV